MKDFREPVELTTSELVAVAGGSLVNLDITVIAANGIADGIANGIANFIFGGGNTIGTGNGGNNGGVSLKL